MTFLPILAVLFIALKLTEVIDWSWWWVTAPLWAIPAMFLSFFTGAFITLFATIYKSERS